MVRPRPSSRIRGEKGLLTRLGAPQVGEEVLDFEPILTHASLLPYCCPQDLLLALPLRAVLEKMLRHLTLARTPPALAVGLFFVHSRHRPMRQLPV